MFGLAVSHNRLGALFLLTTKETAKMKIEIQPTPKTELMLHLIRNNHIDISPMMKEELDNVLPSIIENIISNVYNMMEIE